MDVLVDDRRDRLVELELERGPVLDVVLWERKPKGGVRSSGLGQVLAKTNAGEVTQPDGATVRIAAATAIWAKTAALTGA